MVDEKLPMVFQSFLATMVSVLATLIVIASVTPWFLIALLPIGLLYAYSFRYYVRSSRELKRLDSVSRSPVYAHFGEALDGCQSIRCGAPWRVTRGVGGG